MQKLRLFTIALFIIWGALIHGFFYELETTVMLFLLSVVLLILFLVEKKLEMSLFQWLLLFFAIAYWVSIFYAQDQELALEEALKVTSMVHIGFIAAGLTFANRIQLFKLCIWVGSGLVIVGVVFSLYRQNRLESTIEYANTLAIFLLSTAVLSILFYLKEHRIYLLIHLAVQFAGVLLTLSRSVWILWILAILLLIFIYKPLRTKKLILRFSLVHLAALALAVLVKWDVFFFLNRVQSIQSKASELQIRFVYWQDSLAMIRDHLLLGTGGGGWSVLLQDYSNPMYYVKYAHNQYLQIFLDVGLIGIGIFISLLLVFYEAIWEGIQMTDELSFWSKGIAVMVTLILLHAGFDFDLSFPFMLGIVSLAMSMSTIKQTTPNIAKIPLYSAAIISLLLFTVFTGLLTIGYSFKQKGEQYLQIKTNLETAQKQFDKAKWFLPWSSKAHYDAAKGYILQGNQTNSPTYYEEAKRELEKAIQLSPKQSLYPSLLIELNKAGF